MKKEITLGNLLIALIPTLFVIIGWGNTISNRVKANEVRIESMEKVYNKVEIKLDKIQTTMTDVLVELQNKKNRD